MTIFQWIFGHSYLQFVDKVASVEDFMSKYEYLYLFPNPASAVSLSLSLRSGSISRLRRKTYTRFAESLHVKANEGISGLHEIVYKL